MHFLEIDSKLNFETSEDVTVIETFEKLGLKEDLLRGIFSYGWYHFHIHFYNVSSIYNVITLLIL